MPELSGRLIGSRYRLDKKLGQGGMGVVYTATQESLGRGVAVKVLLPFLAADAGLVARFKAEAERAGRLSHPHIVQIFDFGADPDGVAWIAMELLDGEPLGDRIDRGALSEEDVVRIGRETLSALEAAHASRLVHRDLKPDNVFLARVPGVGESVKVLDFGIAKALDSEGAQKLTATGMLIGTPLYMAPEQAAGRDVDPRSDLYSLGVVLYEALTGRVPFEANNYSGLVYAVISVEPQRIEVLRPGVTPELAQIIHRAMSKDPAQRFQNAREMADALARITLVGSATPARSSEDASIGVAPTMATPVGPATTGPAAVAAAAAYAPSPAAARASPPAVAPAGSPTPAPSGRRGMGVWIGLAVVLALGAFAGAYALGRVGSDATPAPPVAPVATIAPIAVAVDPAEVGAGPMVPSDTGTGTGTDTGTAADTGTDTDTADTDPGTDTGMGSASRGGSEGADRGPRRRGGLTMAAVDVPAAPLPIPDEGPPPAMPPFPNRAPGARVSCSFVSAPGMPFRDIRPAVNSAGPWGRCWPPTVPVPDVNRGRCFNITVSGGGRVQNVAESGTDNEPAAFQECAVQHLRAVVFPAPDDRTPHTFQICFGLDELPAGGAGE